MSKPFVLASSDTPGYSSIYRHPDYVDGTHSGKFANTTTLYELFLANIKERPTQEFLGYRQILQNSSALGDYQWISSADVATIVSDFGSGLDYIYKNYAPCLNPDTNQQPLGIFSINRPGWVMAEQAAFRSGRYTVGISDAYGVEQSEFQIKDTDIRVLVCSIDKIPRLLSRIKSTPNLKVIISFDNFGPADPEITSKGYSRDNIAKIISDAKASGITLFDFNSVVELGKSTPTKPAPPKPSDLSMLIFNNSSIDISKRVYHTHESMLHCSRSMYLSLDLGPSVHLSHFPLKYAFEHSIIYMLMHGKVSIGFSSGNDNMILDDMKALRPTVFVTSVNVLEQILDKEINNTKTPTYTLPGSDRCKACQCSYWSFTYSGNNYHVYWGEWDINSFAQKTGGRISQIISCAPNIPFDIRYFFSHFLSCNIVSFFGMPEIGGGAMIGFFNDLSKENIFIPCPGIEIRLRILNDNIYYNKSKTKPSGELLIRSKSVFARYNKRSTSYRSIVDGEWYATDQRVIINSDGTLELHNIISFNGVY